MMNTALCYQAYYGYGYFYYFGNRVLCCPNTEDRA